MDRKELYLQYDKLNWEKQEKTKISFLLNDFIIKEIFSKKKGPSIKVFDIGFGVGAFLKMINQELSGSYEKIILEGCEPSTKNYEYFKSHPLVQNDNVEIKIYNKTFQDVQIDGKFDFITAIYIFSHFNVDELEAVSKKIHSMLTDGGKFILVVANEEYIKKKLKNEKDLLIKQNTIVLGGKEYQEFMHYSKLPEVGTIIDMNREEQYYLDLFKKNDFELVEKKNMEDSGFICTIFVFEKNK